MARTARARRALRSLPFVATLVALALTAGAFAAGEDPKPDPATAEPTGGAPPSPAKAKAKTSPGAALKPRQKVKSEPVVYGTLGGQELRGFLARPREAKGPLPALVVIHEVWGPNELVQAQTRRLAGEGYVALAVDLYDGKRTDDPETARAMILSALDHPQRVHANLERAFAYLRQTEQAKKIGVVGWSFGGGIALDAAISYPDRVNALVVYYGMTTANQDELQKLRAPMVGFFGGKDPGVPLEGVRAMEDRLRRLHHNASIVVYPNAEHGFANPYSKRFDAAAEADAWKRTTEFLAKSLGGK